LTTVIKKDNKSIEEIENEKIKEITNVGLVPELQQFREIDNTENDIAFSGLFNPNESFIPNNSIFMNPQDETIPIRERALIFFRNIIGNDDIKENLYRVLLREDKTTNILLVGPPATSKTLLCKNIEDQCNNVIFYDASAGSTGAGLIEILRLNKNAKILIIDEISELRKNDIDVLRGLLNDGRVSKTLKSKNINFRMKGLKVFATTNNPTKLSIPIKSRFQMYEIKNYTNEEFVKVMEFCLTNQNIVKDSKLAKELAYAMIHYNIKNIRNALSVCSLVHDTDTYADIKRIIETYIENDGSKLNINYNVEEE
jgi:Holliday junction DNA helicase RuvB